MKVAQEQGVDISKVLESDEAERTKELEAEFDKEASLKSIEPEETPKPEEKAAAEEKKPAKETPKPSKAAEAEPTKPVKEIEEEPPKADFEKQLREREEMLTAKEARIQELEAQVKAGKTKEERAAKIVEADKLYSKFVEERSLSTMKAIDTLSEDDPDYDKKIAGIRAREASDIKAYERQHPELGGFFYDETPSKPQETVAKPKETVTPKPEAKERTGVPDESVVELKKFVSSSATKAGLDPEDATFTFFCNKAPTTYDDGDAMPFEDQVAWAIERTKNYQTFVQTESTERGKERQKKSLPLGRGTGELPPSKTKEFKPVTISDALDQVRQERTL